MKITLPWPGESLFPNKSNRDGGKYPRRNAAKEYRAEAKVITLNVINGEGIEPELMTTITQDFYPPNEFTDWDGIISALKSGYDGIFDGLKVLNLEQNDNCLTNGYWVKHPADKLNPRVVICLIGENENERN
jgi:hypothetical protein